MKMITAIIRPEKLDDVKAALFAAQVEGLTITRVSGHGGEKTVLESYRGHPLVYEFHDKVRLDIGVSEPFVDVTIEAIVKAGKTGQVGDGKIFVMPIEKVVRIRTGELDRDAVTPVQMVARFAVNAHHLLFVRLDAGFDTGMPRGVRHQSAATDFLFV